MRLRKRGGIYHAEFYEGGRRVRRTTHTGDRRNAEALGLRWERAAADPAGARARDATLMQALDLLVDQRAELATAGERSVDTVAFYARKSGVLARVFAEHFGVAADAVRLERIDAAAVDAFVSTRRGEWADERKTRRISDHTIVKELTTLRAALKLAKRRGLWRGDLDEVMPDAGEVSAKYAPKERWLPQHEVLALVQRLGGRSAHSMWRADRAARIAFAAATSAERGALDRAERADAQLGDAIDLVLVRGTKRPSRWRTVPVVTKAARNMLRFALAKAQGEGGKLFRPWANADRDIKAACRAAGIAPCSYNDLRRTFAQWLRQDGVPLELVAPAMGHVTTTMVQRVYGKLDASALADRIALQLSGPRVAQTRSQKRDARDGRDRAATKRPAKTLAKRCRRSDLNQRPWDYDAQLRFLEKQIGTRGSKAAAGQGGPPVSQPLRSCKRGRS
jgi:integrase